MLSPPSIFSEYNRRAGSEIHTIVKLTDGTTTWLFSDKDIDLADGHVYPLLLSGVSVTESIDITSKQWRVGDVNVDISNMPYRKDSSNELVRFCDEITDLQGTDAEVYQMVGPNTTALSDCLKIFAGTIFQHPVYDYDRVRLRIVDKGKTWDKMIPATRMLSVWSANAYDDYLHQMIPLVYGKFTFDIYNSEDGLGMAKGFATVKGENPKMAISDHVLNALTSIWLDVFVTRPVEIIDPILTVDDSGRGTATPTQIVTWAYFWPNTRPTISVDASRFDYNMNTRSVNGTDYFDNTSLIKGERVSNFAVNDENGILALLKHNKDIGTVLKCKVRHNTNLADGIVMYEAGDNVARLYYAHNGTDSMTDSAGNISADGSYEIIELADTVDIPGDKNDRLVLAIHVEDATNADGVTDNITLFTLVDICLIVPYVLPQGYAFSAMPPSGRLPDEMFVWAACEGRKYDSWITGRSSNYAHGDCIEDPAGIIESLLRDELGLGNDDLVLTSFIDAENTSVKARLNVVERESTFDIIRRLAEQSTFAFHISGVSRARLIALNDKSPTTNRTIPASHILPATPSGPPSIKISKTAQYADRIRVFSRWQAEYNLYRDYDIYPDGAGTYTREHTYNWPNIATTSVDHILDHLMNVTDGLWRIPRVEISFRTAGYCHSDIEVGDWIEIDDASMDGQMLCYGDSWSDKQFLVIETEKTDTDSYIKAIELW